MTSVIVLSLTLWNWLQSTADFNSGTGSSKEREWRSQTTAKFEMAGQQTTFSGAYQALPAVYTGAEMSIGIFFCG